MAYIAATLNPEILKKIPGPFRVGKKKSGSGRVAGTRQGLPLSFNRPNGAKSVRCRCYVFAASPKLWILPMATNGNWVFFSSAKYTFPPLFRPGGVELTKNH